MHWAQTPVRLPRSAPLEHPAITKKGLREVPQPRLVLDGETSATPAAPAGRRRPCSARRGPGPPRPGGRPRSRSRPPSARPALRPPPGAGSATASRSSLWGQGCLWRLLGCGGAGAESKERTGEDPGDHEGAQGQAGQDRGRLLQHRLHARRALLRRRVRPAAALCCRCHGFKRGPPAGPSERTSSQPLEGLMQSVRHNLTEPSEGTASCRAFREHLRSKKVRAWNDASSVCSVY